MIDNVKIHLSCGWLWFYQIHPNSIFRLRCWTWFVRLISCIFPVFHRKAFEWCGIDCCACIYGSFTHERMNVTWQSSISDPPPVHNLLLRANNRSVACGPPFRIGNMMKISEIYATPSGRSVLWTAPGPRALRYGPSRALTGPGLPPSWRCKTNYWRHACLYIYIIYMII